MQGWTLGMNGRPKRPVGAAVLASAMTFLTAGGGAAQAQETVTVFPNEPEMEGSCWPFGVGGGPAPERWGPYMAFFYKSIPPFELKPGDALAFDMRIPNDNDIELEIAMAPTTTNGGTQEAAPFQTVVANDRRPTGRGDTIVGNFDLQFTTQAPFSFPGGGLAIRFSNSSAAYLMDNTCDSARLVAAHAGASEPLFVQRAYQDTDGVFPWPNGDPGSIGAFQVTTFPPPETAITSAPPDKTRKRTATFGFTGSDVARSSGRAIASFECKLDAGPFAPCTSPVTYRVKKGVHSFEVRAIDEHGNADSTPATDTWKVKKKKKKKK